MTKPDGEQLAPVTIHDFRAANPAAAAAYFARPESADITELIAGEIIVSPTPVPQHQRLSVRLERLLDRLIPNGELFHAPLAVQLDDYNVVEPDILWVAEGGGAVVGPKFVSGPPALIVEILSPASIRRDRVIKFAAYETFGVAEYWLVDPDRALLEAWTLVGGQYAPLGTYGRGERFSSPVLNRMVDLETVFTG